MDYFPVCDWIDGILNRERIGWEVKKVVRFGKN
jgi:hypothetical protein